VDVYQTEGEYVLIAEIAGLDARSVTIEIDEQEVAISGEREIAQVWAEGAHVAGAEGVQCLQLEIPCGEFERRLVLPTPVDASAATATFDRGMLTVRLPRVDRRPTRVQVDLNT
jgi:HSP20 family protein